ncbi:MAG: TfoX/Sxy family protein [Rhodospirillaceae bacterium]|nr:TfoX/Sxy family protein [Rhodospirillaceae bacterium]
MAVSADFLAHLADQLAGLGRVEARRLFGAAGLFHEGLMFGLVAGDVAYFKVGEAERADYTALGAKPFSYRRTGRIATVGSFYEVPAELLDDPDRLVEWARRACATARAADTKKTKKKAKAPRR